MDEAIGRPAPAAGETERVTIRLILGDRRVRVVLLTVFVIMLGFGLVAPVLPLYAKSFGVSYQAVGLLVSSFMFMRLVFDLVAGPIVDRFGERACVTSGVMFVGITSAAAGLPHSFLPVLLLRAAGGAGSAILFAALYSYMLKIVPKHRMGRSLSLFYGTFNVGLIAGEPVGGLIAHLFGLASPLFFYGAMCIVAGLLFMRWGTAPVRGGAGTEARAEPLFRDTRSRVGGLLKTPGFVTAIVANLAALFIVGAIFDTLIPLYAQARLHMSTIGISAVLAVSIATEFLVLYPAGAAADRHGRRPILLVGFPAYAALTAAIAWTASPLMLGGALGLLGIASGIGGVAPGAMLSDVVPDNASGTAVGVFRFCGDLGFVLGPLVAGSVATFAGFEWAFAVTTLPLLIAFVLALRTPETLASLRRPAPVPAPG